MGNAAVRIVELAGPDIDTVIANVSLALADNVENLTLGGVDALDGTGNSLANHMIGNLAANSLYGMAGRDLLDGKDGNDWLDGGTGIDTMLGGAGDDVYIVDNAGDRITESYANGMDEVQATVDYVLSNNVERLFLMGTADLSGTGTDNDQNLLVGNSGDNHLYGLGSNDTLDGGLGKDTLEGGFGDDLYFIDSASE